jgi:pyrroline-5-carboxylate reductase
MLDRIWGFWRTIMSQKWTLGLIGSGVMAETLLAGVLGQGLLTADQVIASDPNSGRRAHLADRFGIRCVPGNGEVLQTADLVVLCVKPQSLKVLFAETYGPLNPDMQILSIVAGASISALAKGLGHSKVARAMPNLPCRVHSGTTVWTGAQGEDAARIRRVLSCMGDEIEVDREQHIDRATAVNGTGPAIIAEFVKAMMEAATFIGEPRDLARASVLSTLKGTLEMIEQSDSHVAHLIDEVTSPGGTTSRALQVLKQGRMAAVVTDSINAAYMRTLELGANLED